MRRSTKVLLIEKLNRWRERVGDARTANPANAAIVLSPDCASDRSHDTHSRPTASRRPQELATDPRPRLQIWTSLKLAPVL